MVPIDGSGIYQTQVNLSTFHGTGCHVGCTNDCLTNHMEIHPIHYEIRTEMRDDISLREVSSTDSDGLPASGFTNLWRDGERHQQQY